MLSAPGAGPASLAGSDGVALAHRVEARGRVGVEQRPVALDERDDVLAEIPPSGRPLVVGTAAVVVWAVEGAARIGAPQPLEGLLVADVHPQRHLRLTAVAPEVALAHEETEQESDRQIVRPEAAARWSEAAAVAEKLTTPRAPP